MRTILAAILALAGFAGFAAFADPVVHGTLSNKHRIEVADNSTDPKAATAGEFMHDYPRGAPYRMRMFPTKPAMELTVKTEDGKRIKVTQDLDEVRDLEIGSKVAVDTVDGKQKVIAVK
ncbi:MAG TPA: hypothetical protein VF798_12260 [Burkholderiaceae bacterium]